MTKSGKQMAMLASMKRPWLAFAIAVSVVLATSAPREARAADVTRSVPDGGGLEALVVSVNPDTGEITTTNCTHAPCTTSSVTSRIATKIDMDARALKMEVLDLPGGKRALWLHVPSKKDPIAYDLLQAGANIIFQGQTGFTRGQPGSMTGETLEMADVGGKRTLVHAQISESFVLCGRGRTFLSPEVLDAGKLAFVPAAVSVLSAQELKAATPIVLSSHSGTVTASLVSLLVSAGTTSAADGRALVAGDDRTSWTDSGRTAGRGEIALFRGPIEVPIGKLSITITKPPAAAAGVAPKTMVLTTGAKNYLLTLPEDAMLKGGGTYDVTLPEPIKSSCFGVVFDQAYDHGQAGAHVTVAEIRAYSVLELGGATLATIAPMLSAGGATSDAAVAILKRAGERALVPLGDAWPKLDEYGRELAIDAAAASPCGISTPLLLQGLCSASPEIARKSESALARCNRASMIVSSVHDDKALACPKIAGMLALLGREAALAPLTLQLGKGDAETQMATRQAWATAARDVSIDRIIPLLKEPTLDVNRWLEVLRALGPRVSEMTNEATAALDEILAAGAPLARRWLAVGPLSELAKSGSPKDGERFAQMMSKDPDWPVRARAAELAVGVTTAQAALLLAIDDPQPRVREAALRTIATQKTLAASAAVQKRLESDPWTFVRLGAAQALGAMPAAPTLDTTLATALAKEKSSAVEEAILDAIGGHRAKSALPAVRDRFDDEREDAIVRAAAARTLGALCDLTYVDQLTEIALHASDPLVNSEGLGLTLAAIEALGAIHPKDIASRLRPLDAETVKDAVRATAKRAIAGPGTCK
ncbi:hypothetical protein BH09MYX1_BH09MYX1_04720 [soil metagenome]